MMTGTERVATDGQHEALGEACARPTAERETMYDLLRPRVASDEGGRERVRFRPLVNPPNAPMH
jgi:hypothetical protein